MNLLQSDSQWLSLMTAVLTFSFTLTACAAELKPKKKLTRNSDTSPSVNLYAAGDIAYCTNIVPAKSGAASTAAVVMAALENDSTAKVVTLGDNTYPVGLPQEFNDCYDPTWGQFKARTMPSPGNHDYSTPDAGGYYGYFGDAAGPERLGYYSKRVGSWHVVALNSNLDPAQLLTQLAWLKAELAQQPTACTLAYWHHPLFSSGGHGNSKRMHDVWQVLMAAKADVVLVGHDHDYERFAPQDADGNLDVQNGIRQFVVGTGGAKLTRFRFEKANSEVRDYSTHGVLKLVLKDKSYGWEFLPVAGGTFADTGTALCH
ncbi:MAG: metallophosphoesterase [Pseudomonadota bacterium]